MTGAPNSVVVVGGGLAGYTLANALRRHDFAGRITVIEQEPALYDRPPLSKAAFIERRRCSRISQFTTPEQLARSVSMSSAAARVVALEDGAVLD